MVDHLYERVKRQFAFHSRDSSPLFIILILIPMMYIALPLNNKKNVSTIVYMRVFTERQTKIIIQLTSVSGDTPNYEPSSYYCSKPNCKLFRSEMHYFNESISRFRVRTLLKRVYGRRISFEKTAVFDRHTAGAMENFFFLNLFSFYKRNNIVLILCLLSDVSSAQ